jgi:hypothetical protein
MFNKYAVCYFRQGHINDLFYDLYNDHKIEKLNLNLCKSILGVGSKASNLAVVGELGRYPLYIDIVISMIKYWIRLHEDKTNCMLKEVIDKVIFTFLELTSHIKHTRTSEE